MTQEETKKNKAVEQLKKKEKDLQKEIAAKKKDVQKLNDQIQKIINEEIRKAAEEARKREQAAKAAGTATAAKTPKTTTFDLTPEEKILSNDFANNKGKLPWPTERGVISGSFGEHEHPVVKGVMVVNHGIDILTTSGANARAVFNGTVTRVFSTPKGTKAIIIRHGDYLTVYSNLESVVVKENQKVTTKQNLGEIHTDEDNKTELQFQVWKGNVKMNPAVWVKQ